MSGSSIKTQGYNVAGRGKQDSKYNINDLSGMYIGQVIKNNDSLHTGRVTVRISDFSGKATERICLLCTPFGGHTDVVASSEDEKKFGEEEGQTGNGSPKSYGMWSQPPAINTNVVVLFTAGMEQGVYIGSLISKDRNAMMGGNASSQAYKEEKTILSPSSEKNPYDRNDNDTRPSDNEAMDVLTEKGTDEDYVRGHSMSSARRETPSLVFGMTTREGHVISLDDGQEDGPSRNIRIKTKQGAQILLDDTHGFINIINQNGSSWIEIDSEGRIDMYSKAGVSISTEGDYNVHAKGHINMQADQGVNIKSTGNEGIKIQSSASSIDIHSALAIRSETSQYEINASSGYIKATGGRIDLNGPPASSASKPEVQAQTVNSNITSSIASRVPEHQPWLGNSSVQESFTTGKGNTG